MIDDHTYLIKCYFSFLLGTHDPKRAIILTSILYRKPCKEIMEICKEEYEKHKNPIQILETYRVKA